MKNVITGSLMILLAAIISGCTNDEGGNGNTDRVPLVLDVACVRSTRAVADGDTAFKAGDKIAVSAHIYRTESVPIAERDLFLSGEPFSKMDGSHSYYDPLHEYFAADDVGDIYLLNGVRYDFFATYPHDAGLNDDLSVAVDSDSSGARIAAVEGGYVSENDLMTGRQMGYAVDLNQTSTMPSVTLSHRLSKVRFSIIKSESETDEVQVRGIAFNSDIRSRTWNQVNETWVEDAMTSRITTSVAGVTPAERYSARNTRIDLSTPYLVETRTDDLFCQTLLLPDAQLTDICLWLETTPAGGGTSTTRYMKVNIDLGREIFLKQGKITQINLGYSTTNIVYIIHVYTKNWETHPVSGIGSTGDAVDDQYDL